MDEQEKIKRIREGALSMEVGGDDKSAITGMMPIAGILHIFKENSIHACRLADDIDPKRTNPHVPNVQQKILSIGSNSELTARTLLTAKYLFEPKFLIESFDCAAAISLSLAALKDLAAMQDINQALIEAESKANLSDRRSIDRSIVLPSVGEVFSPCKSFLQKSDHSIQSLFNIAKLFFGNDLKKGWFESLQKTVERKYGPEDRFVDFINDVLPFLKSVRHWRNCVEHPKPSEYVSALDYALNEKMELLPPTIEIIHPKSHQLPMLIVSFMREVIEQISKIFEMTIAFMCSKHVRTHPGFPIQVVDLPNEKRREKNVRFGYGMFDGDQIIPTG